MGKNVVGKILDKIFSGISPHFFKPFRIFPGKFKKSLISSSEHQKISSALSTEAYHPKWTTLGGYEEDFNSDRFPWKINSDISLQDFSRHFWGFVQYFSRQQLIFARFSVIPICILLPTPNTEWNQVISGGTAGGNINLLFCVLFYFDKIGIFFCSFAFVCVFSPGPDPSPRQNPPLPSPVWCRRAVGRDAGLSATVTLQRTWSPRHDIRSGGRWGQPPFATDGRPWCPSHDRLHSRHKCGACWISIPSILGLHRLTLFPWLLVLLWFGGSPFGAPTMN